MAAAAGKVALVSTTVALSGACPTGGAIVDFVGYGTTANCFEGTGPTAAPSNTTSAQRNGGGATDTDNNAADFTVAAPDPHASADQAPTVASTFPANGATDVDVSANLTVTFSEPVNVTDRGSDLTCNSLAASRRRTRGGPTTFTIDPVADFVDGEACTLTVIAANVADQDDERSAGQHGRELHRRVHRGRRLRPARSRRSTTIQGSGATAAITGNVTTAGRRRRRLRGRAPRSAGFYIQDADRRRRPGHLRRHLRLHRRQREHRQRRRLRPRHRLRPRAVRPDDDQRRRTATARRSRRRASSTAARARVAPTDVTMPFADDDLPGALRGHARPLPAAARDLRVLQLRPVRRDRARPAARRRVAAVHAAPRSRSRAPRRTPGPRRTPPAGSRSTTTSERPEPGRCCATRTASRSRSTNRFRGGDTVAEHGRRARLRLQPLPDLPDRARPTTPR